MREHYFRAAALSGLLALTGCASSISLSEYQQDATLQPAARLPTEADLSRQGRAKVVVFETDDSNLEKARRAQAGNTLTREIEQMLGANGAEVIDRGIATKLGQELQLAEVKGVGGYEGPSVANYAVKPTITQAEYDMNHVPATSVTNKKGKTTHTPASYNHKASVNISLRVYEIPSLRQVKTVNGRALNANTTSDNGSHDLAVSMLRAATQKALNDASSEFLNLFTPKGYVLGRRDKGNKSIFRISIGSDQGIVPGNKIMLFTEQESIHPITRKTTYDKIPVVDGKVTDNVTANDAWIVAEDDGKARRVRLGDLVEVVHRDSILKTLLKPLQIGQ